MRDRIEVRWKDIAENGKWQKGVDIQARGSYNFPTHQASFLNHPTGSLERV